MSEIPSFTLILHCIILDKKNNLLIKPFPVHDLSENPITHLKSSIHRNLPERIKEVIDANKLILFKIKDEVPTPPRVESIDEDSGSSDQLSRLLQVVKQFSNDESSVAIPLGSKSNSSVSIATYFENNASKNCARRASIIVKLPNICLTNSLLGGT